MNFQAVKERPEPASAPNIDQLAAEGMRFNHAYAGASICSPSRACLISGMYSPRHSIYHQRNRAYKMFRELLAFVEPSGLNTNYSNGGGTYPNLFDAHPPFQIDGNFGGAAGVVEFKPAKKKH